MRSRPPLTIPATAQETTAPAPPKKAAPARKLELKDLSLAVEGTVQDESKGTEIKNTGKETEHGAAHYEVEILLSVKYHGFNADT